jgi:hypothetical protein
MSNWNVPTEHKLVGRGCGAPRGYMEDCDVFKLTSGPNEGLFVRVYKKSGHQSLHDNPEDGFARGQAILEALIEVDWTTADTLREPVQSIAVGRGVTGGQSILSCLI